MNLLLVVLLPLAGAALTGWVSQFGRMRSAWAAGAVTALALIALLPSAGAPFRGETILQHWPWIPEAGLGLAFRLDGLGLLFALMILGIGLLVILYARYYLAERGLPGALLRLPAALHGLHAGHRAVGEPDPAADLLGADQPLVLPA